MSESGPLSNAPGVNNWDRVGGLPRYIRRVARDIMEEHGKTEGEAIAIAKSQCDKICAGTIKVKDPAVKAKACAAVAEWLRKVSNMTAS